MAVVKNVELVDAQNVPKAAGFVFLMVRRKQVFCIHPYFITTKSTNM